MLRFQHRKHRERGPLTNFADTRCGAPTNKGRPCRNTRATCRLHGPGAPRALATTSAPRSRALAAARPPGAVLGGSGFVVQQGRFLRTDHNPDIAEDRGYGTPYGTAGIYDQMDRTLPCISLLMRLITMPMRSLNWDFRWPTHDRGPDEILRFCQRAYFDELEGGFPRYLSQVARGTPKYGYMPHEVEEAVAPDGALVWRRFLQRMPFSIREIHRKAERLDHIVQSVQLDDGASQQDVTIPADRMLWSVFDLDGDHLTGNPLLRPAYGPWKNTLDLWRYAGIRFFRKAVPVPWGKLGSREDWDDEVLKDDVSAWLKNVSADPEAFILLPPEAEVGTLAGEAASDDIIQMARYYSWEILSLGLGQFLALGTTDTGSRAVGDVHAHLFWRAFRQYVVDLAAPINDTSERAGLGTVKALIDRNFGPQSVYPYLYAAVPRADNFESYAAAIKALREADVLRPSLSIQDQIREEYDMPPLAPEERATEEARLAARDLPQVFAYHLAGGALIIDEIRARIGAGPDPDRARGAMTVPEYQSKLGVRPSAPSDAPAQ